MNLYRWGKITGHVVSAAVY